MKRIYIGIIMTVFAIYEGLSKPTLSSEKKFPKLIEFFKQKPDIHSKYKLKNCDADVHKEHCGYRVTTRKKCPLSLRDAIAEIIPEYISVVRKSDLLYFSEFVMKEFRVHTCSNMISFKTRGNDNFMGLKDLSSSYMDANINIPIPLGDSQLFAVSEWSAQDVKFKTKFNKENKDIYNIKGYCESEYLPLDRIGNIFDVDILPNGPVSILLHNINIDRLQIKDCKIYGSVQPLIGNYELAFSGEGTKQFGGSHIHVFITKDGQTKNLAILIEFQDHSPVYLLKRIYGSTISRANILRDRNQTIALYISKQPTANFSNTYTSHGSSRWLHRDSHFDPGAYLLVTLPFPKRKALDMKIELLADGLSFSIPESESLSGELILGAISPEKIIHANNIEEEKINDKNSPRYSKMKVLKFRYFLFNDTYLAAVESHLSDEEELADLMPVGRPDLLTESNRAYYTSTKHADALDRFFTRKTFSMEMNMSGNERKRNMMEIKTDDGDPLAVAEKVGLL